MTLTPAQTTLHHGSALASSSAWSLQSRTGFVANSRLRADLLGGREHTQKGQGLRCMVQRKLTTTAETISRVLGYTPSARDWSGRYHDSGPLANLQTPPAFQSFVDDDIHASTSFDKGLDEEPEQLSASLQGCPEGTG